MRRWLLTAPRPVLALVAGVPVGIWFVLSQRFWLDRSWSEALVSGGIGAVLFGALMAVLVYRQNRRTRAAVGSLSNDGIKRASRASMRGPVPADPEIRTAAHGLATAQLDLLRRQRVWAVPFLVLVMAACAFIAITQGSGWWVVVLVGAFLFGMHVYLPRHLRRRIELLRPTPHD